MQFSPVQNPFIMSKMKTTFAYLQSADSKESNLSFFRHSELFCGFLNILSVFEQCAVALKWTRTTMSREPNKSANREVHQRCHAMSKERIFSNLVQSRDVGLDVSKGGTVPRVPIFLAILKR